MPAITKTNDGLNLLRSSMGNLDKDTITYVALGTSSTAPTASDHTLGTEVFRKRVTSSTVGATGEILINMYLAPNDSVGTNIQEVGFFGGNSATSTPNSGIMIARGLYVHNPKTNLESIQFQIDWTIA